MRITRLVLGTVLLSIGGCAGGSDGPSAMPPRPPASCIGSVLGCATSAGANFTDAFNPVIAGVPVSCRDANGQAVATVLNPNLANIGGAMVDVPPTIRLNPNMLFLLPAKVQLFWYGHECAHHFLGHALGVFESSLEFPADCRAVDVGREQGWLTRQELEAFEPYVRELSGSTWGHLPGWQRARLLLDCWDWG